MEFEDMYVLANDDVSFVVGEKTYVFEKGNVYFFSAQELMEIFLTDPTAAQAFMAYVEAGTFEVVFLENADQYVLAHETVETLGRIFEEGNVYFVSKEELDADLTEAYYFAQYVSEGILEQVEHIVVNVFVKESFWFGKQYLYKYSYYTLDTYDYIYDPILASGVIEAYDSENDEEPVSVYAYKGFSDSVTGLSMYQGEYRIMKLKNGFPTYNGVMQNLILSGYIAERDKPVECDLVNILIKNDTNAEISICGCCKAIESTGELDFKLTHVPKNSTQEIFIPMSAVNPNDGGSSERYCLYFMPRSKRSALTANVALGNVYEYSVLSGLGNLIYSYFYEIWYKTLYRIKTGFLTLDEKAAVITISDYSES